MDCYTDEYIRTNPRRNAKCDPILYRDNYKPYFKSLLLSNNQLDEVECFENINTNNNVQIVNNNIIQNKNHRNGNNNNQHGNNNNQNGNNNNQHGNNNKILKNDLHLDNYTYLKCVDGKAFIQNNNLEVKKMYDIDPKSIMKKTIIGDIQEIDKIHNNKIKQNMSYDKMKIEMLQKSMKRLHHSMNDSMLSTHTRDFLDDEFFQN